MRLGVTVVRTFRGVASAVVGLGLLGVMACDTAGRAAARPDGPADAAEQRLGTERLRVQIVQTYPHDPTAFTQGLVLAEGRLFESTGLEGRSSLREVDVTTGRVLRKLDVPAPVFAEGLALVGARLFQITWKHETAYTYDRDTFKEGASFPYRGEGWGLCYDGRDLVMSDGSARLTFRGPETFRAVREVVVREGGQPVEQLNELECVGPDVYANVWMTDRIVRIDPKTGAVTATIDAANLLSPSERYGTDVLNGIAHDPSSDTFLLTGKLWPKMFRVRFVR
ncbi:MAG: glutaminyl-peptide cyclotransferase [Acidobacteria bacterium]|nr:glutaminyl-peptide cyclotransferase [Acidobacteriota bacterium]